MKVLFIIPMALILLIPFSSASASWHWSSPHEVCGTEVIKKGEKCDLRDKQKPTSGEEEQSAYDKSTIPEWIRYNAKWWSQDSIDDQSFVNGIQYLITKGIMDIPVIEESSESSSTEIPSWIKSNAGWWADGQIDDDSFVSGIQFMIKAGIIRV